MPGSEEVPEPAGSTALSAPPRTSFRIAAAAVMVTMVLLLPSSDGYRDGAIWGNKQQRYHHHHHHHPTKHLELPPIYLPAVYLLGEQKASTTSLWSLMHKNKAGLCMAYGISPYGHHTGAKNPKKILKELHFWNHVDRMYSHEK